MWKLSTSQADRINYDEFSRSQGEDSARVLNDEDLMRVAAEHIAFDIFESDMKERRLDVDDFPAFRQGYDEERQRRKQAVKIYALTERDAGWVGIAAAYIGGFVTSWRDEDNGLRLPNIVHKRTGRFFLGTMPGIDETIEVSKDVLAAIIAESEMEDIQSRTGNHPIIQKNRRRAEEWITLLKEWEARL